MRALLTVVVVFLLSAGGARAQALTDRPLTPAQVAAANPIIDRCIAATKQVLKEPLEAGDVTHDVFVYYVEYCVDKLAREDPVLKHLYEGRATAPRSGHAPPHAPS